MKDKRDFWPDPSESSPVQGVELQPMSLDHLDEVVRIENDMFPTPWTRKAFEYDLSSNQLAHYFVLKKDDKIIGYSGIWLFGHIAHLTTICITREFLNTGLGRWLLLKTMKLGEEMGVARYTLEVRETNTAAIKLYENCGYRKVGVREKYYHEIDEDAVVMWTGGPPYDE